MSGVAQAARTLVVQSEMDGARGVLVTVRDTGVGLDPAGADRLVDPFYTTNVGGMGLAISRSTPVEPP